MIVLDASVVVELFTDGPLAGKVLEYMVNAEESFIAPHLLDVEVVNAIRGLESGHRLDTLDVKRLLSTFAELPAERYAHTPLLGRVWELRHNFTAYDAVYIALAEETGSTLLTADSKQSKGHRASVKVIR